MPRSKIDLPRLAQYFIDHADQVFTLSDLEFLLAENSDQWNLPPSMTIDADQLKVVVSSRIREEFENGRDYYHLHGRAIRLPRESNTLPSREYLAFHNSVFR